MAPLSVDFCCASAMWSDERETPWAGLGGLGRADRGEGDIVWWSDQSDDDGGVEADRNTRRPRWCRARVVEVSRAPVTTRREAQGPDYSLEPIHYVINLV